MRRRSRLAALPVHRHALPQIVVDAGLAALAYFLAFRLRFDEGVPTDYQQLFENTISFVVIGNVAIFAGFGLYRHWMRYSSQREYLRVGQAVVAAVLALVAYVAVVKPKEIFVGYPRGFVPVPLPASVPIIYGLLMLVFLGAVRYAVRMYFERPLGGYRARRGARSVLIVGAGDGGRLLLREILRNPDLGMRPVGFVDDDPRKQGVRVDRGLDVLGTTEDLSLRARGRRARRGPDRDPLRPRHPARAGRARLPRARRARAHDADGVRAAADRRRPLHPPGPRGARRGRARPRAGADGDRGDGRLPDRPLRDGHGRGRLDRRRAVAARSRAWARAGSSLLDHAEDNLFEITRELVEDRHALNTVAVLADCKEEERMREVFQEHRPTVVFHAAAYKHVGLMEENPVEAVRNNAIATRVMSRVAGDTGTKVFIQVSTDKAVDPATVMGASKALAEWAAEAANARYDETAYASVRFGNVLNSSGSVVPIFRRQIEAGGPVTVTDPDMTRFFMTIPEAVQLVIRAGSLAQGGEVFVLEMGEPVRIIDLAEDMIRFSGLEPGRDIAIDIVGRRPGEKLHEDLFNAYEHPEATPAQKILRARRPAVDPAWVEATFDRIGLLVLEGDAAGLATTVSELATGRMAAPAAEPRRMEAPALDPEDGVELPGSRTAS